MLKIILIIILSLIILGILVFLVFGRNPFTKHRYVRIITFKNDKSSSIQYIKRDHFKPSFLVNPNHIFIANGYTTFVITENSSENINPLDFTSKYDPKRFETAINSKIIQDTFATLKTNKIDFLMISVLLNVMILIVLVYMIMKSNGVI